jgi:hypothetical protein
MIISKILYISLTKKNLIPMVHEFKWDNANTEKLIRTKHSDVFISKFETAVGRPKALQKVWEELADVVCENVKSKECKIKYNAIYSKYKMHLDGSKISGSGAVRWKFWEIFHNTFPKKNSSLRENIEELGSGDIPNVISFNDPLEMKISNKNVKKLKKIKCFGRFENKIFKKINKKI